MGQVQGPEIMLGCPYIKNDNDALGMVNELGGHGFFSEWVKGNIDSTIMENYQTSVHEFTSFVNNKLESGPMDSLRVFVTHDFNILLMLGLIHDLTDEQYQWPGYLDGGLFIKKGDGLWLKMHGKYKRCLDWKTSGGEQ